MSTRPTCLVIGSGVGLVIASELAARGAAVTLIDRRPSLMTGASGRTGRRLHFGEHYSGDVLPASDVFTVNTGRLCFLGALRLCQSYPGLWSPAARWWQFITTDSMTSVPAYEEHLASLRSFHDHLAQVHPEVDSLVGSAASRHRHLETSEYRELVRLARVAAGFESREPVLSIATIKSIARERLLTGGGRVFLNAGVEEVALTGSGAFTASFGPGHVEAAPPPSKYEFVVNATWTDTWHLDSAFADRGRYDAATARLRLMVARSLPGRVKAAPSCYFHRGVMGNHTNLGRQALVTAEAISNLGFSSVSNIPQSWSTLTDSGDSDETGWLEALEDVRACTSNVRGDAGGHENREAVDEALAASAGASKGAKVQAARAVLAKRVVEAYGAFVPAFTLEQAPAWPIFSTVMTSSSARMADPLSPVHMRGLEVSEPVPGYVSVYPGKLTLAQLVADAVAERLMGPSGTSSLAKHVQELIVASQSDSIEVTA